MQDSNVPTLLIGGNLDCQHPPGECDPRGSCLTSRTAVGSSSNLGHADDFWPYEPAAGTRLINTYLDTGKVDTSLYTPNKVDFSQAPTKRLRRRPPPAR